MNEGQKAAATSVPWGGSGVTTPGPAPAAGPPSRAPHAGGEPGHAAPRPRHAAGPPGDVGGEPESHVRVDDRKLEDALLGLRAPVVRLALLLDCPGVEEARADRAHLLGQIDDYLLPRLRQSSAPLLVAMVGSTGAGKSTLLNSIAGSQVSATGIRRPTTNSPVLACHPDDIGWFAENVFLPTLPRVRQSGLAMPGRDGLLVLAASDGMPRGVALLDTPDIDSVVAAHRQFARQFLDASDLWLFVTTARRYADAAVWELLKDARDRGAALGIVLSRVPPPASAQLTAHFGAMLEANGLGEVQRFVIPETTVTDAQLPAAVSAPVRAWLRETAVSSERRIAILTQTMSGVLDSLPGRVAALAEQAQAQVAVRAELRAAAEAAYAAALAELDEATRSGSLLRGEVLARWQDFAGTGDLLRTLQVKGSRRPAPKGRRQAPGSERARALKAALRTSVEALIVSLGDRAAEDAIERWRAAPAGAGLLAQAQQAARELAEAEQAYASLRQWEGDHDWGFPDGQAGLAGSLPEGGLDALGRSSPGLPGRAAQAVAAWQEHLLRLVQTERVIRRSIARVAAFDPESLALVLTIGALGYGAGDVVVTEGASAVPQRLLASLFGAGLMRDIGGQARQDLHQRVGALFAEESLRFTGIIDAIERAEEGSPADLYAASNALESAR